MPPIIVTGPSKVHCARLINALVSTSTEYIVEPRRVRTYGEAYSDIADWYSTDAVFFIYDSFPHVEEFINDAPLTTKTKFTLRQEALDYRISALGGRMFIVSSKDNSLNAAYKQLAKNTSMKVTWFPDTDLFDPEALERELLNLKKR